MNKAIYRNVLSASQKKLSAAIEQFRSSIPHSGEKGAHIERLIRAELRSVLPEKIGVGDGFVVDSNDEVSKQMDIVLYDKLNSPRIFASDSAQIFPVEMTYACGEVKSRLERGEFINVFEKCDSYKSLVRKSYVKSDSLIQETFRLFGSESNHWKSIFFCISIESMSLESLLKSYRPFANPLNHEKRVDSVFSLDGKCLINSSRPLGTNGIPGEGTIDLLPNGTGTICAYKATEPWSLFIFLLLRYMVQVPQVTINMLEYDSGKPF